MEATFCFVDLAGFSALTEAHGDAAAADLVLRFTSLVTTTMGVTARLVKTIGDAAFVALPAPAQAVGFIGRLVARIAQESDFPVLRAGMHHGDAVERNGDVFGAAVNLAARLAGRSVTSLGSVRLRNLREPVELFDLGVDVCDDEVIDPVCRMRVAPGRAVGRLTLSGSSYWFCSLRCAGLFARDPGAYAP
jgi:adenylate cyclase